MKFYYNNKLVRTSKTHNYKYGVFTRNDNCEACASTYELAEKAIVTVTRFVRANLEYYKEELKAIEQGKEKFWVGRNFCKVKDTAEDCKQAIENCTNYINGIHIEELTQSE